LSDTSSANSPQIIRLAISTCPNDTFAFHAILENKVDLQGLEFDLQLLDIQQLNDGLFNNQFDVAKASFHAAALLTDRTVVLPSGSAIGFGVGPLLLAAQADRSPSDALGDSTITVCPGEHTTAAMLFQLFYEDEMATGRTCVEHRLFSEIMPSLKRGEVDFGVCIHEGRFTWQDEGLYLVEDLGARWENETRSPLPLGGILVRRDLDHDLVSKIQSVIKSSIQYGLANREETLATMRKYAQEFNDDVLFGHVELYVNDWTIELGAVGTKALQLLSTKARQCGLIEKSAKDIEVWSARD
jgi:1,4-dihydroxy-6-naphthoate synthase